MEDRSLVRMYALVIGAVLTLAGVIGFFYESSFSDDPAVRDGVFGILDVNGWHNIVHLASGLLGLMAWRLGAAASRQYALGFGLIYTAVAVWGFIVGDGDSILSIVPVNTEDNVLHLVIGLTGLAVGATSEERATTGRPAATT